MTRKWFGKLWQRWMGANTLSAHPRPDRLRRRFRPELETLECRLTPAAPVITSNGGAATAAISVGENTTSVTTVVATDADAGDTVTYSISGADAAKFSINPATGVLAFLTAPDFETPTDANTNNDYLVTVQASDGTNTDTQDLTVSVTNANEFAPVITSNGGGATAAITQPELDSAVTTVTATDGDTSETLTYSLSGTDAGDFSINASTGVLTFAATPNFEAPADDGANNVYDVTVVVSDGTTTDTQALTVTVTNVTDTPVITSNGGGATAAINVAENTTAVTTVTAVDDGPNTTLTFSLSGGADAAKFSINGTTGVLTFATAPNFETPTDVNTDNVYEVTVQVSDGTNTDTQALAVTVTNVNEFTPVITSDGGGATADINVAENTTAVTTVTATDADTSETLTFSIVGGDDAAKFSVNGTTGVLTFITAPNFEAPTDADANNVYLVTVQASDGTNNDTQAISVTVTPASEAAPVITSNGGGATAVITQPELVTAVTTVTATDADMGEMLTYSLSGTDAGDFTINSATGVLTFVAPPNFEAPTDANTDNVYLVTVQVSDGTNADTQALTVTVTNASGAPVITSNGGGATATIIQPELVTSVTTVTAVDDEGGALTFSLSGADAGDFTINPTTGVLTFAATPNFEAPANAEADNDYHVTVVVSDGTNTDTQDLTVTVTNVTDTPVITSNGGGATAALNVAENTTAVTTVSAVDDGPNTTLSFSLSGGADAAKFTINGTTGVLTFLTAPDFETPTDADANNVYLVTVQVSDGTTTDTQALSVLVTPVNESLPVISSNGGGATAAISVGENTTAVTTVVATDADAGDTITYSISGADAAKFSINPTTGVLAFLTAPDFETPTDANTNNDYLVTVQASDGTNTDTQDLTVSVTNVNEFAPVITSNGGGATAAITQPELDSAVTTVTATDGDTSETLTYSLSGTDMGDFTINASTGVLTFAATPNFEAPADSDGNNVYLVTVQVSDGTTTDTQALTITVTNVTDTPVITSDGGGATAAINVAENTTAVTTVTAVDDGPNTTLTFSLSGGADAAKFSINGATGVLAFAAPPNFETPTDVNTDNVYEVTVQVSDGTNTDTQALAVTVTNVNEFTPVITSDGGGATADINVAENTTAVTTVTATDADTSETLTFSIVGGTDAAKFSIDPVTGVLAFLTAPDFEVPTDNDTDGDYNVTVQVSDGTNIDTQAIHVTVTDVNDTPENTVPAPGAITTTGPKGTAVALTGVSIADEDGGTFQVVLTVPTNKGGTLSATASGSASVTGSGTGTLTIAGTLADVNATLASLSYARGKRGVARITMVTTDQGTGTLTDTDQILVAVKNNKPSRAVTFPLGTKVYKNATQGLAYTRDAARGLLRGAKDGDGDTLTVVVDTPPLPAEGTLVLNPDGSFTLTPAVGFTGNKITFTIRYTDGVLLSNPFTVKVKFQAP